MAFAYIIRIHMNNDGNVVKGAIVYDVIRSITRNTFYSLPVNYAVAAFNTRV